ncbi:synaptobrevin family protein [Legionella brunensis]|uniref:Synaptobrevin n=1 Tax=Legionella brunensis TaxID=29422 RepID=A0A0W0S3W6_9GAMM|nr:synaptobrevin family protein [Legionella brunensis]KTC78172.1 Synaptobrevin [Legionella brunensis]
MKCFALGTRFGDAPFQWLTPGSNMTSFFAQKALTKHKQEIVAFCETLGTNETQGMQKDGYYFFIKRVGSDYCVVVTDTMLNEKQMNYLGWYLLRQSVSMSTVAADLEKHTKDFKVESIKQELAETQKIMLSNLDKVIERGERIEEVLAKSENLATSSFHFKQKAEELNSCWPSCVLI